mmetsp:Transcript_20951/g.31597  ORF Transcript_20951/g.31597 Transcript_20951/m.31597 type:complete len:615 (+) Transcript_20951:323-2167(+)
MTSISAATTHTIKTKKTATAPGGLKSKKMGGNKKATASKRGSAPPLKGSGMSVADLSQYTTEQDKQERIVQLLRKALGDELAFEQGKPRTASTTRDRSQAAADLALCAKTWGSSFVLKQCDVMNTLQRMLFPEGLDRLFVQQQQTKKARPEDNNNNNEEEPTMGLRPSLSSVSLASMAAASNDGGGTDDGMVTLGTMGSGGTGGDVKRGKTTPPAAREGSLLLIRALCERVGKGVEPYVVTGFLAAALDECGSSSSTVREAAEDTATALIAIASPWAFSRLIFPMILLSLESTEWRVKYNALERLSQCATTTASSQVNTMLPKLIPEITSQVFDTKAQVQKAAGSCLLAICGTCSNPDVAPAIPAIVKAIQKPSETHKAVEELMATTFVAPVDAATLSILCPVLARALKEKLAIRKRSACLVIQNMSRLVESPEAVAPFGPLLVPELQKVSQNVQFEEIRDAALSALNNLTKALGDAYSNNSNNQAAAAASSSSGVDDEKNNDEVMMKKKQKQEMEAENARITAEQERIELERKEEERKEEERRLLELEERKKFKEAMDAQRELDKIAAQEALKAKQEEENKREKQKLSTKNQSGKCQMCGLKKCKKTCMFYGK